MRNKLFAAVLTFSVLGAWCGMSAAAVLPIVSVTGHHQGDNASPGAGSILTAVNGAGVTMPDVDEPSTWTHSNAWPDDWQGQSISSLTSNVGWMVTDLGSSVSTLKSMYLWNVNEAGGTSRGVAAFDLYYSNTPIVTPPTASSTPQDYNFTGGGWTKVNTAPLLLQQGTGVSGASVNGVFDLSGVSSARYVGLEFITHYGASADRTGLAEVVFTDARQPALPVGTTMVVPVQSIYSHQQGDSLVGDGSRLTAMNLAGVNQQGAPDDPSQWTHTNSWQTDWQGSFSGNTPAYANQGWAVIDLGVLAENVVLDELFLWNVNEGGGLDRGTQDFDIYYSDSPTVMPPYGAGFSAYDFSSGGWTKLGDTQTLAQGTGSGTLPVSGLFDIRGAGGARYIGIDILSNYGSTWRVGIAEIAVTGIALPEPSTLALAALGLFGLALSARRRRRP